MIVAFFAPLAVSPFANTALLARHREWMRERNGGSQRIYQHVTTYVEADLRLFALLKRRMENAQSRFRGADREED